VPFHLRTANFAFDLPTLLAERLEMNRRARELVARLVIVCLDVAQRCDSPHGPPDNLPAIATKGGVDLIELDRYPSSSPGWTINVSKTLGQARYLVKYDYGVGQRFESYMELSLTIAHTAGKLNSFS
jgi:hypothetical protein